jgi:hypothetical protein
MDEDFPDQAAPGPFKGTLQGLYARSAGGAGAAGVVYASCVDGIVLSCPD